MPAHPTIFTIGHSTRSLEEFLGLLKAHKVKSPEFNRAVDELVERSQNDDLVIMCAEAVPWRCHRSLIGDALLVRGVKVLDIMSEDKAPAHKLTPFALVDGSTVTYPPES